jgi:putative DNA-invertase from lambdoid prophage Rac
MRAAIYARVSTNDQNCDMQLTELREYLRRNEWENAGEYVERASGKAGAKRPQQQKLLRDARLKAFDAVVVWKIDRFGRSVGDFVQNLMTLDRAGVRFIAPSQGIDTDHKNPFAVAMMQLMAVFAELERALIVERVTSGQTEYRRAYANGDVGRKRHSRSGRDLAHGRPKAIFDREVARRMRFEDKMSWPKIALALGVDHKTIRRGLGLAA